jgi:amidase
LEVAVSCEPFRLEETTVEGIHSALRAGEVTCRGLVESYLARIEAYDENGPEIGAMVTVNKGRIPGSEEKSRISSEARREGHKAPCR